MPPSRTKSAPPCFEIEPGDRAVATRKNAIGAFNNVLGQKKVAATPIATLTKKPIDLREKKVLDLVPEQVSKISILTDVPAGG